MDYEQGTRRNLAHLSLWDYRLSLDPKPFLSQADREWRKGEFRQEDESGKALANDAIYALKRGLDHHRTDGLAFGRGQNRGGSAKGDAQNADLLAARIGAALQVVNGADGIAALVKTEGD